MLPEISHRCPTCGAAVRTGAHFCPQCGARVGVADTQRAETTDKAAPLQAAPEINDGRASNGDELLFEEEWKRFESNMRAPAAKASRETDAEAERRSQAANVERQRSVEPLALKTETPEEPAARSQAAPQKAQEARFDMSKDEARATDLNTSNRAANRAGAGERGGRAAAVREGLRPRVEKVREASIVMLEEASDDSGLRFILVAVVLFILFLLFLFLHTFLT